MAEAKTARITVKDKEIDLPVLTPTVGPECVDIRKLYGQGGVFTFDPGYGATASCESKITYIDGDAGVLMYRGYPIEELAKSSTFLEVAYLLIYGELPDRESFERMERRISRHRLLHEDFRGFFTSFPSSGHPMAILQAGIAGLATYYEDTLDPHDPYERELATVLLLWQAKRAGVARTVPAAVDEGWRHGTVHYSDDSLRYYRLTSLKPGPNVTFARQGMEISGRRAPEGTETDILDGMLILQVQTAGRAEDDYELAMGPGAVTAFQSWLESRQSARSQRRRSA